MNEVETMLIRIKKLCKEKNIGYKELSIMTEISISTLSKIMAGITKDPTITAISKIARSLDVTLDYLVYGEKVQKTEKPPYDLLNDIGKAKADEYISDLSFNPKYKKDEQQTSYHPPVRKIAAFGAKGTKGDIAIKPKKTT